jgi:hypothetical protein
LPAHIDGNLHNALIRQYQLYKGLEHISPNVPKQLRWTSVNPMNLLTVVTDSSWQIVTDNKSQTKKQKLEHNTTISSKKNDSIHNFVVAKGATPVIERNNVCNSTKCKAGEEVPETKASFPLTTTFLIGSVVGKSFSLPGRRLRRPLHINKSSGLLSDHTTPLLASLPPPGWSD